MNDPMTIAPGIRVEAEVSRVRFKDLSDETIRTYVESGDASGKAGAYGIQGLGASARIEREGVNCMSTASRGLGVGHDVGEQTVGEKELWSGGDPQHSRDGRQAILEPARRIDL